MNKQSKGNPRRSVNSQISRDYDDMMSIMESDLEDYEIAAELGVNLTQVSKMRRELLED